MATGRDGAVLRHVGRIFGAGTVAGLSDGQLLERYSARRDPAAFEALLDRHGSMVLAVCRGLLADPNDADDAFQATFLVLARRAGAVRVEASLGPWLHGVTHRVAARCRADAARRAGRGGGEVESLPAPPIDPDLADLRRALHEEVARLPEKYRAPIVLCYLQGRTHDQAAAALRWPVGTVRGRLARARDLLRPRLVRRGLAPSAGLFAACLPRASARAAVPEALTRLTLSAATGAVPAAGRLALVGAAPAAVASLSDGVLRSMMLAKLKIAAAVALVAGTAAVGARVAANPPRPAGLQLAQAKAAPEAKGPGPAISAESTPAREVAPATPATEKTAELAPPAAVPTPAAVPPIPAGTTAPELPPPLAADPTDGVPLGLFMERTTRAIDARIAALESREQKLRKVRDELNEQLTRERPAIDRLKRMRESLQGPAPKSTPRPEPSLPPPVQLPPPGEPRLEVQALPEPPTALEPIPPLPPAPSPTPAPMPPPAPSGDSRPEPPSIATLPPPRLPEPPLSPAPPGPPDVMVATPTPPGPDAGRDRRLDELEGKLDRLLNLVGSQQRGPVAERGGPDEMIVRNYEVADLVAAMKTRVVEGQAGGTPIRSRKIDMEPLVELLTASVAPGTWLPPDLHAGNAVERQVTTREGRAMGTITPFFLNLSLIVRHTPEVHEQFTARLRQLRRVLDLRDANDSLSRGRPVEPHHDADGQPAKPVQDGKPATSAAKGGRNDLVTRDYPVEDLVAAPGQGPAHGRNAADMAAMLSLVTKSVAPETWWIATPDPNGGSPPTYQWTGVDPIGTITPNYGRRLLTVRHTPAAHDQVAEILRQIRSLKVAYVEPPDLPPALEPGTPFELLTAPAMPRAIRPQATPGPDQAGPRPGDEPAADTGEQPAHEPEAEEAGEPRLKLGLAGPDRRITNRIATYRITVENPSTAPARRVRVAAYLPLGGRLYIPKGATFDPQKRQLSWPDFPQVGPGDRLHLDFKVLMGGIGRYQIDVEARGENTRAFKESRATVVNAFADVSFDVFERARVLDVGQETEFEIRARNNGSKDATKLLIGVKISDNLEFVGTSGTNKPAERDPKDPTTLLFPAIDRLAPKGDLPLSIKVKAVKSGVANCRVSLMHDDLGNVPMNRDTPVTILVPDPPSDKGARS